MSESVSGVDAILAGLRESRDKREASLRADGGAMRTVRVGAALIAVDLLLADAEAAVHATAQKYQAALARQGAMLDRCRDERLSWEDVEQHVEAAVHATVREIEAWLDSEARRYLQMDDPLAQDRARYYVDIAGAVARRFGGTT